MPKQSLKLRNSKKILASTAAVALALCATPSFANEAVTGDQPVTGEIIVESTEGSVHGPTFDDPDAGQPAEPGEEGPIVSTPSVDKHGNTVYQYNKIDPNEGQPAEPGEGPLGAVTPKLDANIGNKKVKAQKTVKYTNPKTGDSSVLGYAGIGLASVAGLFRKRK